MAVAELDRTHALLTPGQGNQRVGMGAELARRSEAAVGVWKMADEALFPQLGYQLTEVAWNLSGRSPEEAEAELQKTEHAQLAVTTETLALKAAMEESGQLGRPGWHAGNSVGMIAALVNAGSLSVESAVHLAKGRGEAFRLAIGQGPSTTMMSLVGIDQEIIDEVRERYSLEVCLINTPGQIVLGGPVENIGEAVSHLKDERGLGRGVHKLKVDAAFHSKYMERAVPVWEKVVAEADIATPKYGEVVGGSTVTVLSTPEAIRRELVLQLTSTERYAEVIKFLRAQGVTTMTELNTTSRLSKMHAETLGIPQDPRPFDPVVLPKRSGDDKVTILGYRLSIPVTEKVSRNEILAWYLEWVSNRSGLDIADLNAGMHFAEDAGLDSEDLAALRAALYAKFGKTASDEEAAKNVLISMAVDATYNLVNF